MQKEHTKTSRRNSRRNAGTARTPERLRRDRGNGSHRRSASPKKSTPAPLSAASLLNLPAPPENSVRFAPDSLGFYGVDFLSEVFGFGTNGRTNFCGLLDRWIEEECGIPRDLSPLEFSPLLLDYETATHYCEDDYALCVEDCSVERSNYSAIALIADSCRAFDVGAALEELEAKHSGVGRYVLALIEGSKIGFYTPRFCYDQGDYYFRWDDEIPPDEIESVPVSREQFVEYYPAWSFAEFDWRNAGAELSAMTALLCPEAEALEKEIRAACELDATGQWLFLTGADAAHALCWTNGRNPMEEDPLVRAMDEEHDIINQSSGLNPGAQLFEFVDSPEFSLDVSAKRDTMRAFLRVLMETHTLVHLLHNRSMELHKKAARKARVKA